AAKPAAATPVAVVAAKPVEATPPSGVVIPEKERTPVTPDAVAQTDAKKGAGRNDPMKPLPRNAYTPWPRFGNTKSNEAPPPPDSGDANAPKVSDKLVPPPPPTSPSPGLPAVAGATAGGLPIDQLPVPPSKPAIGNKLKVLAVMDDRAILAFPAAMTRKNKWPKTLTLGPGEQFESISVVAVTKDGVT